MSSDLVKRLRELAAGKHDDKEFALDAAERIEALEGEVKTLSLNLLTAQGQAWDNHAQAELNGGGAIEWKLKAEALEGEVAQYKSLNNTKNEMIVDLKAEVARLRSTLVRLATVTTLDPEYKSSDLTLAGFLKEIASNALKEDSN
jgi:predicted  nucleic acid-binding Zn-ribbon protein